MNTIYILRIARTRVPAREPVKSSLTETSLFDIERSEPEELDGPGLDNEEKLVYRMSQKFLDIPSRRRAVKVFEACSKLNKWTSVGLLGKWILLWEREYRVRWRLSAAGTKSLEEDLLLVMRREGVASTLKAIDAVFSQKMRWAENKIAIITGRDTFTRFLLPLIRTPKRNAGEQSEWTRDIASSRKSGCVEVSL